jgi:hypothetical protein
MKLNYLRNVSKDGNEGRSIIYMNKTYIYSSLTEDNVCRDRD